MIQEENTKKRIFKGVQNVTENISSLVKGKLNVNSLLCTNCIRDMNKDPDSFLRQIICPTSLNESSEDIASTSSVCTSSTDVEIPELQGCHFSQKKWEEWEDNFFN